MTILNVFGEFLRTLELPGERGLDIPLILGYPDVGRIQPTLPLGALVFLSDDYARGSGGVGDTRPRIGQVQPAGYQFGARLTLFARNERELLSLIDRFRLLKAGGLNSLTVEGRQYTIRYGPTEREQFSPEEETIYNHAASTPVWFIQAA